MFDLFSIAKTTASALVVVAVAVTGYTNLTRDIAEVQLVQEKHDVYIEHDKEVSVRVDERTIAMKEQLDRIEKQVEK